MELKKINIQILMIDTDGKYSSINAFRLHLFEMFPMI